MNSNLIIPHFPHNIRIRLAQLKFFLLHPDVALSLTCWLSQFRKAKLSQRKSIGPILFSYYEESLLSSNLNSKLFRFHCVRHNKHINNFTLICSLWLILILWRAFLYMYLLYWFWIGDNLHASCTFNANMITQLFCSGKKGWFIFPSG